MSHKKAKAARRALRAAGAVTDPPHMDRYVTQWKPTTIGKVVVERPQVRLAKNSFKKMVKGFMERT